MIVELLQINKGYYAKAKKKRAPVKRELFKVLNLITFSAEKRLYQALPHKCKPYFS